MMMLRSNRLSRVKNIFNALGPSTWASRIGLHSRDPPLPSKPRVPSPFDCQRGAPEPSNRGLAPERRNTTSPRWACQ